MRNNSLSFPGLWRQPFLPRLSCFPNDRLLFALLEVSAWDFIYLHPVLFASFLFSVPALAPIWMMHLLWEHFQCFRSESAVLGETVFPACAVLWTQCLTFNHRDQSLPMWMLLFHFSAKIQETNPSDCAAGDQSHARTVGRSYNWNTFSTSYSKTASGLKVGMKQSS